MTKNIIINKELVAMAKRYAIGSITSDGETEEDYDSVFENGTFGFTPWEPLENYPETWLIERMENEYLSAMNLIRQALAAGCVMNETLFKE